MNGARWMALRKAVAAAAALVIAAVLFWTIVLKDDRGPLAWPCRPDCDAPRSEVVATLDRGERMDWADIIITNPTDRSARIESIQLLGRRPAPEMLLMEARVVGPGRRLGGGILRAGSDRHEWGSDPVPAKGATIPSSAEDPSRRGVALVLTVAATSAGLTQLHGIEMTYRIGDDVYTDRFFGDLLICPRAMVGKSECRVDPTS
ncbi:hypothetical protein AB0K12_35975 [Nonomuraea sp. NPDC049419]|uniref:hypothetical protein n=1 Tax=Nonomuraea sp. NPDC049419 TaxID=3155772 RepID=UPI0034215461